MHFNETNRDSGRDIISGSNFVNNTSECGTIFNYSSLNPSSISGIEVKNSKFINNVASKFGGVIYLTGYYDYNYMKFKDCYYYSNHAKFGNIVYARSKNFMGFINDLNPTDVMTFPAYFEMYGNVVEEVSILSGERIPEGIMCK